jgi:predicted DsbA family dithiol-disulfide isomerase
MKVEIWSDVVCPWCYIGKRRFEQALSQFEPRDQVEIVWRSFELDPNTPRLAAGLTTDRLAQKYRISRQQAEAMQAHVTELAAEVGLDYHLNEAQIANTFDSHRLIHLAATHGLQDAMKERLMRAYFTESQALGDVDTLVRLAQEVGLDPDEARRVLTSDDYRDAVNADIRKASRYGITGVPFFLFDEKFAVSGAQPTELFLTALERTWDAAHPVLTLVTDNGQGDGVCTDESCAI